MPIHDDSTIARFWRKVDIRGPDECWPWTACIDHGGRGRFMILQDHKPVPFLAHRVAYEIANGETSGLLVCHSCDYPRCCNPAHLWLGTNQDNSTDMVEKERQTRGIKNPQAKLTESDVRSIRRLIAGGLNDAEVATRFAVTASAISLIRRAKRWGWLVTE